MKPTKAKTTRGKKLTRGKTLNSLKLLLNPQPLPPGMRIA
jgi:hypothetical protein